MTTRPSRLSGLRPRALGLDFMGYKFLEHTADVQAECEAPTFVGLLQATARALYAVTLTKTHKTISTSHEIHVAAAGGEELLVRWLQELLFLLETDGFVGVRFQCKGSHLEQIGSPDEAIEAPLALTVHCTAYGYLCDPDERGEEVKGVTYHDLKVEKTDGGFRARVIFDI